MKKRIIESNRTIEYTFEEGLEPIVFHEGRATAECTAYASLHGYNQRIGDTAASKKTEAERRAEILAIVTHLESGGAWTMKAKAAAPNPAIVELAAKLGLTYGETLAKLANDAIAAMAA